MTDLVLNHMTNGNNISVANNNFDKIQDAVNTRTIQSSGGKNIMFQQLDMNGNRIINVSTDVNNPNSLLTVSGGDARYYKLHNIPTPSTPGDAVSKGYFDSFNLPFGFFTQGGGGVNRTYTSKAREWITPEDFGAIGNGIADDTIAFQTALNYAASIRQPLHVVNSHVLAEVAFPSYGSIIGYASQGYDFTGNPTPPTNGPQLILKAGSARLFNMIGVTSWFISGLHMSSTSRTGVCISGGGTRGTLAFSFIRGFANAVGGNPSGDTYLRTTRLHSCIISNCDLGVTNPIDCYINQVQINACRINISHATGSNNTVYTGCKIEFSEQYGASLFGADHVRFTGCNFDRSGYSALRISGASTKITTTGCEFFRSGALSGAAAGFDCHVDLDSCTGVSIVGGNMRIGTNDDGSGYLSPARAIRCSVTTADYISIVGLALDQAATASNLLIVNGSSTVRPPNWKLVSNTGQVDEVRQLNAPNYDSGYWYYDTKSASILTTATGTFAVANLPSLNTFSSKEYTLRLKSRNSSTGATTTTRIPVIVRVEAGPASTVALGTPTTANTIGGTVPIWATSGVTGLVISLTTPVNNGTGFTVSIVNNDATTQQLEVWLER